MLRKSGVKLEKALTLDLPKCRIDPQQFEEVILNLINNAADAMKKIDRQKIIRVSSILEDDRIAVRVSDSGSGISPEVGKKVFDPFYTTKPDSTGIGLSICHRIIADHAGALNVSSSEWGGSEFCISIPIAEAQSD